MAEPARRGRPRLSDDEARRAAFTFRATNELKQKLTKAAEQSERSIAQEIEMRLEMSFAREADAGSATAAALADLVRLVVSRLEAKSGKTWTDDYNTYLAVEAAIGRILYLNQPQEAAHWSDAKRRWEEDTGEEGLEQLRIEMQSLADPEVRSSDPDRLDRVEKRINDLMITAHRFENSLKEHNRRVASVVDHLKDAVDPLTDLFRLSRPNARKE